MDLNLKDGDFWYSLHGQVPGLLDWNMGNKFFLSCTIDQCPLAEQSLAKHKIQVTKSPALRQERKPNCDDDDPPIEPSLWMWVNPNVVCPLSKTENLPSMLLPKDEETDFLEVQGVVESLPVSTSEQCPQPKQFTFSNDSDFAEAAAEEQEDTSSQEKDCSKKPTLHVVSLALRNHPSSGLNVQQIYSFTLLHFPYFWTAPEGWKSTIHHSLCSLTCFEKVTIMLENGLDGKPRSCLWKLTEEGYCFFENTHALAFSRKERIRQCMLQPELMDLLFQL
uniref:Forkhead box R2 n=1 Tax=Nannospalax galili TaxID=1026970 RepID=A0A8C6W5Y3_NANGA